MPGHILVDLDGTLAHYDDWKGEDKIGEPVPAMVNRVKKWLDEGIEVRIFTARASGRMTPQEHVQVLHAIHNWCHDHLGVALEVTNEKDYGCIAIYDDRAWHVVPNEGRIIGE